MVLYVGKQTMWMVNIFFAEAVIVFLFSGKTNAYLQTRGEYTSLSIYTQLNILNRLTKRKIGIFILFTCVVWVAYVLTSCLYTICII